MDYVQLDLMCDANTSNSNEESEQIYKHHYSQPHAIMEAIKAGFKDLSHTELLKKKCVHGCTKNENEIMNNVIWTRIPRNVFVEINMLRFKVYDATAILQQRKHYIV